MTDIIDLNGVRRDEAWVYGKYGAEIVRETGSARFQLVRIEETAGKMEHFVHVQDAKGTPLADYQIALHWDGAPWDLNKYPAYVTRYDSPVEIQSTNANGDTGFELGPGGYTPGPPQGGPHHTWVLSDRYPSDVLAKHGWKALTFHEQLGRLVFVLVVDGGPDPDPDPDEPPVDDAETIALLSEQTALLKEIRDLIKAGFRL